MEYNLRLGRGSILPLCWALVDEPHHELGPTKGIQGPAVSELWAASSPKRGGVKSERLPAPGLLSSRLVGCRAHFKLQISHNRAWDWR